MAGFSPSVLFDIPIWPDVARWGDYDGDGILDKDGKALEKFFRTHDKMPDDAAAKRALAAWLTMSQEFRQDGMFKFEVIEKEFIVKDGKVIGRAVIMQGGNGELHAELTIGKDGVLASATEKAAIRPGPRPICQATKLLDADPIAVFTDALNNIKPTLEVRSRRVGGANYQVPMQVKPKRAESLATRWLLAAIRAKSGRPTYLRLAEEIMAAYQRQGEAMSKREQTIKMAEANKAFSHFAW